MERERRSGMERRKDPPAQICDSPCPPLLNELKEVYKEIKSKPSYRIFLWLVGSLAFFTIIIVGGAQWKMAADISAINTNVEVVRQSVTGLERNVNYHISIDDARHLRNEDKIDKNKDKILELRKHWNKSPHNDEP